MGREKGTKRNSVIQMVCTSVESANLSYPHQC